jgi:hypothetical protein
MFEFFEKIQQTVVLGKDIFLFFIAAKSKEIYNKIISTDYERLQYDIIFYINRAQEKINSKGTALYKNNSVVAKIVDYIHHALNFLYAIIQFRRVEPLHKTWSCVSALTKSYSNYKNFDYRYNEIYEMNKKSQTEDVASMYSNLYSNVVSIINQERSLVECLLTFKHNNKYIHRISNPDKNLKNDKASNIIMEDSEVRFISIEYHSKNYLNPIVLELDKNEYLVNNELFSAIFIKRALEYQCPYHVFDRNYTLLLLDNNLRSINLNFGEYIVLHKTYYSILTAEGLRENVYLKREEVVHDESSPSPSLSETGSSEIDPLLFDIEPLKGTVFRESFGSSDE